MFVGTTNLMVDENGSDSFYSRSRVGLGSICIKKLWT